MNFFDTSVYVAAFQSVHLMHRSCIDLLEELRLKNEPMACGAHSMSELYSVLTRVPPPYRLSPRDALRVVERIAKNTMLVSLNSSQELDVIRDIAKRHLVSGIVHDAGLIACARKAEAKVIYTLNVRHFRLAAPDIADRILTP